MGRQHRRGEATRGRMSGDLRRLNVRALIVRRNHVRTLWRLPDGTTRWVPWEVESAPGTDHSFSWEATEEDWRRLVLRRCFPEELAAGGSVMSPIDGMPTTMDPRATVAYRNSKGTQWVLPGGEVRWVPWPTDDEGTGAWHSWMPNKATWQAHMRSDTVRVGFDHSVEIYSYIKGYHWDYGNTAYQHMYMYFS